MNLSKDASRDATLIFRPLSPKLQLGLRIVWLAITGVTVWLFLTGLPLLRQVSGNQPDLNEAVLNQIGLSLGVYSNFIVTFEILMAMSFVGLGLVVFWYKANDLFAMISAIAFVLFGVLTSTFVLDTVIKIEDVVPPGRERLIAVMSYIGFGFVTWFLYAFPKGDMLFGWLKWFFWTFIGWMVGGLIWPQYSLIYVRPFIYSVIGQLIFYGVGIFAQLYNYRKWATRVQKQQTKWFVFAIVLILVGFVFFELMRVYTITETPSVFNAVFHTVIRFLLWYFPRMMVPVFIGAALFRYRLWDVDFLINRSIVYGGVVALLVGVFGGILYGLSTVFEQSYAAFGVASVVVGLLFQPSLRRMRLFVDRNFYDIKIDYKKGATESRSKVPAISFQEYTGLELIGRGGMAEVYKAQHPTFNEHIALKLLPEDLAKDPEFRWRFEREAEAVSMLDHPNIVEVYDHGQENEICFMVMEYISGQDLSDALEKKPKLTLEEALPLLKQMATALDYAHDQGLVHRDIKPSNIMIDEDGRPVLMDFGIAKILDSHTTVTKAGFLGTLDYIAPEQIQGSSDVDRKADVYSFGVMVYEILTGELPFKYNNPGALLMAHMTQPPPNPRDKAEDLLPQVAFAIIRSMAKNQEERFETVGEFVQELMV